MARGTSTYGQLAMVETSLTHAPQMAMFQASTLLVLELLISLASRLSMMKNVHQKWW